MQTIQVTWQRTLHPGIQLHFCIKVCYAFLQYCTLELTADFKSSGTHTKPGAAEKKPQQNKTFLPWAIYSYSMHIHPLWQLRTLCCFFESKAEMNYIHREPR